MGTAPVELEMGKKRSTISIMSKGRAVPMKMTINENTTDFLVLRMLVELFFPVGGIDRSPISVD
jgi:hypothetical protein